MIAKRPLVASLVCLTFGVASCGQDAATDHDVVTLETAAATIQAARTLDFDSLDAQKLTLRDLQADAEVVGVGRISDVRGGYSTTYTLADGSEAPDSAPRMLVVIRPEQLSVGKEVLGESGEVVLDLPAPPIDRATGEGGIATVRSGAVDSEEQILFVLRREEAPAPDTGRESLYAGRQSDDPLLVTVHPSSILALRGDGSAFPLLTDEQISPATENLEAFRQFGIEITRFTVADTRLAYSSR